MSAAPKWSVAPGVVLDLRPMPRLMAIVNVTPDSFSDGGRFLDPARAVEHALRAIAEGASFIDIGGESTRPGAAAVDAAEQRRRVCPIIRALRRESTVPISIDTTLASVAEAALDEGASIVNDTSAGADDPHMLPLIAARGCGVVLMHRRRAPAQEIRSDRISDEARGALTGAPLGASAPNVPAPFEDVVERVNRELGARVRAALDAGVAAQQIVIDPGLGFGKSVDENFELLHRLRECEVLGRPLLIGASRKSFIGYASGVERAEDRLAGSLAAAVLAAQGGAAILRVHDVAPHREAIAVISCRGAVTERATILAHFRDSSGENPWQASPR